MQVLEHKPIGLEGVDFELTEFATMMGLHPDRIKLLPEGHGWLFADLAKALVGMAPERRIPAFAPVTFKTWFRRRGPRSTSGPEVILWPDTFNDHFHPETAVAAVEVLEAAGCRVTVPEPFLCCGRPLYDYGMLDQAKRRLEHTIAALRPQIKAGVPVVGLEPSCVSVFRDELPNLLPTDEDARRLSQQVFLLSEYLERYHPDFELPRLERQAILHGHCHHKAVLGMGAEEAVLRKLGLELEVLDAGCCGMAGAFGFERGEHYDVSIACGERVLLPAVRAADPDTLAIADGFSCREQIAQTTDRRALHLAEVLALALRGGETDGASDLHADGRSRITTAALGGVLAAGALAWAARRRRNR